MSEAKHGVFWTLGEAAAIIERQEAKIANLIEAGDKMRWACRHLVAPIPTGERDWREWNTCIERWIQAKSNG